MKQLGLISSIMKKVVVVLGFDQDLGRHQQGRCQDHHHRLSILNHLQDILLQECLHLDQELYHLIISFRDHLHFRDLLLECLLHNFNDRPRVCLLQECRLPLALLHHSLIDHLLGYLRNNINDRFLVS